MSNYFIYDGRANIDIDDACVLDVFDASNDKEAKDKIPSRGWQWLDVVLVDNRQQIIY